MTDRARQIVAVGLCWLPTLILGLSAVHWWEAVSGDVTTQWSGGAPTTSAPAWTVALFVGGVCVLTGGLATAAAADAPYTTRRWVYLFCFGGACAALVVWFAILGTNVSTPGDPAMPHWLLLFPFAIPLGIVPWLVGGRGPVDEHHDAEDEEAINADGTDPT